MLPPKEMGTIVSVAPPGRYTLQEKVLTIEFMGQQKSFTMMQYWPVRQVFLSHWWARGVGVLCGRGVWCKDWGREGMMGGLFLYEY